MLFFIVFWKFYKQFFLKNFIDRDPLLDEVKSIDGDLWLNGNRVLIVLNLSSNLFYFINNIFINLIFININIY